MSSRRNFRGRHDGRKRTFDWYALARERGLTYEQGLRLYGEAQRQADAERDPERVVRGVYMALLDQVRPRTRGLPGPGKFTRVMLDEAGVSWPPPPAGIGKVALTSYLKPRSASSGARGRAADRAPLPEPPAELFAPRNPAAQTSAPAYSDATLRIFDEQLDLLLKSADHEHTADGEHAADDTYAALAPDVGAPLPDDLRARMERSLGHDFRDVTVHLDSDRASGSTRALAEGRDLYFGPGQFRPGTTDGDWLIGHELAHVVQQSAPVGAVPTSNRRAVEAEADLAASLVASGQHAQVSLHASAGAFAYDRAAPHGDAESVLRNELLGALGADPAALPDQLAQQLPHELTEAGVPVPAPDAAEAGALAQAQAEQQARDAQGQPTPSGDDELGPGQAEGGAAASAGPAAAGGDADVADENQAAAASADAAAGDAAAGGADASAATAGPPAPAPAATASPGASATAAASSGQPSASAVEAAEAAAPLAPVAAPAPSAPAPAATETPARAVRERAPAPPPPTPAARPSAAPRRRAAAPLPAAAPARAAALPGVASAPQVEPDRNAETLVQPNVPLSHQHSGGQTLPATTPVTPAAAAAQAGVDLSRQSNVRAAIDADPRVSASRAQAEQAAAEIERPPTPPASTASAGPSATSPGPSSTAASADARRQQASQAAQSARTSLPAAPDASRLPDAPTATATSVAAPASATPAPAPVAITHGPLPSEPLPPAPQPPLRSVTANTAPPRVEAPQAAPIPTPTGDQVPDPAALVDRSVNASADREAHRAALTAEAATRDVVPEQASAARQAQLAPLPARAQATFTATTEAPHAQIQAGQQSGAAASAQAAADGVATQAEAFAAHASEHGQNATAEQALGPSQPPLPLDAHAAAVGQAAAASGEALAGQLRATPAAPYAPPAGTQARMAEVAAMAPPTAPAVPASPDTERPPTPPLPSAQPALQEDQAALDSTRAAVLDTPIPEVQFQPAVGAAGTNGDQRRDQAIAEVERQLSAEMSTQSGPAMEQAAAPARQQLTEQLDGAKRDAQAHVSDIEAQAAQAQAELDAEPPPVDDAALQAQAQAHWDNYQAESQAATAQAQGEVAAADAQAAQAHAQAEQGYQQSLAQAEAQNQSQNQAAQASYDSAAAQAQATAEASQQAAQAQLEADHSQAQAQAEQARQQAEGETQAQIAQAESQHASSVQSSEQQYQSQQQQIDSEHQAEVQRLQAESDQQSQQAQATLDGEVARLEAEGQTESSRLLGEGERAYQAEIDTGQARADSERQSAEAEAEAKRAEAEAERGRGRSLLQRGLDWVGGLVSDLLEAAADIVRAARDAVVSIMEQARQAALDALNSFRELAQQALQVAMDAIQSAISAAAEAVRQIIQAAADAIQAAIQAAAQALQAVVQALTDAINGLLQALQDAVNAALDGLIALVGMINQEWAQALADASAGFRASFNAAVDQLQSDIQSASDSLQGAIDDAAQALCESVQSAADTLKETVTAVEESLHAAVEVAHSLAASAIDAAFDAAEAAVNAAFDLAEAAVTAWFDAYIAAFEIAAMVVEEAAALAAELVGMAIDLITAPFDALMSILPDALVEGFIDFWNSQWRDAILIGLISIAAVAITVATCGAGAPLGVMILTGALAGGALGGASYFAGEMAARQGAQELDERNGDQGIYVPGQGYVDPSTLIDPATGELRADIPPDQRAQAEWALSNYHVNPDGTLEIKNDREMFDHAVSEGIEGAVAGAVSGATAVAGGAIGGRVAGALATRGAGTVTQVLASAGVEAGFDIVGGGITAGATHFIEAIESGQSLGEAATGALRTLRDQTLSPQAIITGMIGAGFAGGQARFLQLDELGNPILREGAEMTWDTASGVLGEAGGNFTGTLVQELSLGTPLDEALSRAQQAGGQAFQIENVLINAGTGTVGRRFDMDLSPPGAGAPGATPGQTDGTPGADGASTPPAAVDATTRPTSGDDTPPLAPPTAAADTAARPTSGDDTPLLVPPAVAADTPPTRPVSGDDAPPLAPPTVAAGTTTRPTSGDDALPPTVPLPLASDTSVTTRPASGDGTSVRPTPDRDGPVTTPDRATTPSDDATTTTRPRADDSEAVAVGPTAEGISGGKVTHEDFLGAPASDADLTRAREVAAAEDAQSLDQQAASITTGSARSERDMLLAIQNGEAPRFIARVGPENNFTDHGSFANPNRPFAFATEPSDLRGISPAEAMYRVGWTREWIEPNIGKDITVAVLDTTVAVPTADGATPRVEQGRMEWPELTSAALADSNFRDAAEARGLDPADLPELFEIAAQTPVRGTPATSDPELSRQVTILRGLIDRQYGANDLYTGMGATMREDGQLGGREVMIRPNGTGLALTPDNHRLVSLGVLTREHFDALFPPTGSTAVPASPAAPLSSDGATASPTTTPRSPATPPASAVTPDPSVLTPAAPSPVDSSTGPSADTSAVAPALPRGESSTPIAPTVEGPASSATTRRDGDVTPAADTSADATGPVPANEPLLLTGDDARLAQAAARIQPEAGRLDVIVHGSGDRFVVIRNGRRVELDHRSLARFIEHSGGAGQDIRLISCGTGGTPSSVAQHLANKLGVNVIAPSGTAWIHPDGRITIGANPSDDSGAWNGFDPGNRFEGPVPRADEPAATATETADATPRSDLDGGEIASAGAEQRPPPPAPVAVGATSAEALQHAKSVAGGEATQSVSKFIFDASEVDGVKQRARERAQADAERAYDAAIEAGKTPKQARKDASRAARQTARAQAAIEAKRAAQTLAEQAIQTGGAIDTGSLDSQAASQLAAYQGGMASEAKRVAPAVAGMSDSEFLAFMGQEVADGRAPTPRTINISGPPPQAMQMWEYPDGTVVRYKPQGDDRRPNPTYSVEVKKDPSAPDGGLGDIAFKIDSAGVAVPASDESVQNPFSTSSHKLQHDAFNDAVMNAGHHSLRSE